MANLQNGMLPARTQPDVTVIQKKLGAVLFWRDRIIMHFLHNFGVRHVDFIPTRRPAIGAGFSADRQRRFLPKSLQLIEELRWHRVLQDDALHDASTVA